MNVYQIAEYLNGKVIGSGDCQISGIAAFAEAVKGDLAFSEDSGSLKSSRASCLIVGKAVEGQEFSAEALIVVENPKLAFAQIATRIAPPKKRAPSVDKSANVAASARIGENVFLGAFAVVGENSQIGDGSQILSGAVIGDEARIGQNCVIHPHVFIEDRTIIGDYVVVHAGACLGADGFGYVRDGAQGYVKFPQIGRVVIENKVEIGAHTCIDRGALGDTLIGEGTKIDNLVQIAHNVQIGKRVIIAAQTGISGSTIIEDDCVIGGQVGMGDHARVLSGAIIGSQAGVLPGKIVRAGVWWGTPVQPLDQYKRQNALVKGLARLREKVRELERKIGGNV